MNLVNTNSPLDWWGPKRWESSFIPPFCPTTYYFDNDVFSFDSSCPIFDLGWSSIFTFDSNEHLFSSEVTTLNVATFDEDTL